MQKILIVEDSQFFVAMLERKITERLSLSTLHAETLIEAEDRLNSPDDEVILMVLDLGLPGCSREEALSFAKELDIPVIVYTGTYHPQLGQLLRSYNIVDYVLKDHAGSLDYLIDLIYRIVNNRHEPVLLVDDSRTSRAFLRNLLKHYQFPVIEAEDGVEALAVLEDNPDIRVVISDYNMPNMDGFELAKKIRSTKSQHELAIIGTSSGKDPGISVQFLKSGANDFLNTPLVPEEFFCRLSQNIATLELFETLEQAANTDPLTGLRNRRYFYQRVEELLQEQNNDYSAIALMDIDFFKKVNDTYGHTAGDDVLQHISTLLSRSLKTLGFDDDCVLSRFGGEEFCIFLPSCKVEQTLSNFDLLRQAVENLSISTEGHNLNVTISIGVSFTKTPDIDAMLTSADDYLYQAKEAGRNQVISGDSSGSTIVETDSINA